MADKTNDNKNSRDLESRVEEAQKEDVRLKQENLRLKRILMAQGSNAALGSQKQSNTPKPLGQIAETSSTRS